MRRVSNVEIRDGIHDIYCTCLEVASTYATRETANFRFKCPFIAEDVTTTIYTVNDMNFAPLESVSQTS